MQRLFAAAVALAVSFGMFVGSALAGGWG